MYYLSAIAERRGDTGTALRGYQLLSGTALEAAARSRAATILYKEGQRDRRPAAAAGQATMRRRPLGSRPKIAQAQLLSNGGEDEQALARIDDALARFPGHPDLLYQKAILLEKGRPHRCGDRAARGAVSRPAAGQRDQQCAGLHSGRPQP